MSQEPRGSKTSQSTLCGVRFAPSPTGRFHLGNLRTARLSERLARRLGEPWIVRFEDIDRARVQAGAVAQQLQDLAALTLQPDQTPLQSERHLVHWEAWRQAVREGRVYPCVCSRAEVQAELGALASARNQLPALEGLERLSCYSGRCRDARGEPVVPEGKRELGWRFRSEASADGRFDFLVAKTELGGGGVRPFEFEAVSPESFLPAYPWACAIDDADGSYRILVRAWDLAEADFAQREIRAWRGGPGVASIPVFHTALLVRADGGRLEKRTPSVTLADLPADPVLQKIDENLAREAFPSFEAEHPGAFPWGEQRRVISVVELGF